MARVEKLDWDRLKLEFIIDPNKPTLENFCRTRNLTYSTARKRSGAEQWMEHRNKHWNTVTARAAPVIADMQVAVMARDVGSKLLWIDEIRQLGLELARAITVEDSEAGYGEIVTALERVEKLERLILGESTENVKVDDARGFARDLLTIVREEVDDARTLERIALRASALSVGGRPAFDSQPNSLN